MSRELRNMVNEGRSGVDVQLKHRATVMPNLVETLRSYVEHERNLFGEIADLRSKSVHAQKIKERVTRELTTRASWTKEAVPYSAPPGRSTGSRGLNLLIITCTMATLDC
jgi:hypothetical protein